MTIYLIQGNNCLYIIKSISYRFKIAFGKWGEPWRLFLHGQKRTRLERKRVIIKMNFVKTDSSHKLVEIKKDTMTYDTFGKK